MSIENPELSFEFFPPRTPKGFENLSEVRDALAKFGPSFFSVTYGAGGSTQDGTFEAVKAMLDAGHDAAPHLTCVGASRDLIRTTVQSYLDIGVKRIVVLRGDLPGGMVERGYFKYAEDLVRFIREEFGDDLHLEVAAYPDFHPESASPTTDLQYLKRKFDAGANSAITQYFYNADSYFAFVDEAQSMGVQAPIVPCGAELPRWVRARLEQYQHDEPSLKAFGLDVVSHLCLDLLDNGVPGLHFYALNKIEPASEICRRLGIQEQ